MKKTNKMLTKMLTDSWHRQGSEFQGISRPNKEIKYFSRTLTPNSRTFQDNYKLKFKNYFFNIVRTTQVYRRYSQTRKTKKKPQIFWNVIALQGKSQLGMRKLNCKFIFL